MSGPNELSVLVVDLALSGVAAFAAIIRLHDKSPSPSVHNEVKFR